MRVCVESGTYERLQNGHDCYGIYGVTESDREMEERRNRFISQ